MAPNIRIGYLANHQELADELARNSWAEWRSIYERRGQDFNHALTTYRERANIDRLPLALVALDGEKPAGTVSLKPQDLEIRPELTPWLGGLFVVTEWRRRGVGSLLMQTAVEEARRLRLEKLLLWTSSAEAMYLKLGWRPIERVDYCGKRIVIMQIDLV